MLGNPPTEGAGVWWLDWVGATLVGFVVLAAAGTRAGSLGRPGDWLAAPLVRVMAPTQIVAPISASHRRGRPVRQERRIGG